MAWLMLLSVSSRVSVWPGDTKSRSTESRGISHMKRLIAVPPFSANVSSTRTFPQEQRPPLGVTPARRAHVRPFEGRKGGPLVSAPERALLEVLSEVGVRTAAAGSLGRQ